MAFMSTGHHINDITSGVTKLSIDIVATDVSIVSFNKSF